MNSARTISRWPNNLSLSRLFRSCPAPVGLVAYTGRRTESSSGKNKPLPQSSAKYTFKSWTAATVAFLMGCCVPLTGFFVAAPDTSDDLEQRLLEKGTHDESLPLPGQLVNADFRDVNASARAWAGIAAGRPVRVVQWNIERGLEFDAILATLKQLQADVLLIQEVDSGCDRTDGRDVGLELAKELKMAYSFVCEFVEFRSPARDARSQGGGVHGNAIFSHLPLSDVEVIEHSHHPVDWNHGDNYFSKREPRKGRRLTLAAHVHTPAGPIQVYSAHLEVFCGAFSRLRQFADILMHARASKLPLQILGGDLNTMGHGIARLSPYHCNDRLRWTNFGQEEAAFWFSHLFTVPDPAPASQEASSQINQRLFSAGLRDEAACAALTNPGFKETFPLSEPTLDHPSYRVCGVPLMNGKLDWLLHRGGLAVADSALGNHEYTASDHKWLGADFSLPGISPPANRVGHSDKRSGPVVRQQAAASSKPALAACM